MSDTIKLPPLIWKGSPNFSSRRGKISLIVIHDTEGGFAGTVNWFSQLRSHVSAHLVLSEDGQHAEQMVGFRNKAWACCWYNSASINIEMAGFEAKGYSEAEWASAAAITAYLCHRFDIPIQASTGAKPGIARHFDLGRLGGGHKDPCTDSGKWLWFLGLVAKASATATWPEQEWGK